MRVLRNMYNRCVRNRNNIKRLKSENNENNQNDDDVHIITEQNLLDDALLTN